jgi:hypothetical protein
MTENPELRNQATETLKATEDIRICLMVERDCLHTPTPLFVVVGLLVRFRSMRTGRKILLSKQEVDGSLDQDIDDYEDSRIELQAIGLNLVSF